jgi:hypothetical protein
MASGSFVFEDEFLHSFHSSSVLLIVGYPEHSTSSAEVAVLHPKMCVLSVFGSPEAAPNI